MEIYYDCAEDRTAGCAYDHDHSAQAFYIATSSCFKGEKLVRLCPFQVAKGKQYMWNTLSHISEARPNLCPQCGEEHL